MKNEHLNNKLNGYKIGINRYYVIGGIMLVLSISQLPQNFSKNYTETITIQNDIRNFKKNDDEPIRAYYSNSDYQNIQIVSSIITIPDYLANQLDDFFFIK